MKRLERVAWVGTQFNPGVYNSKSPFKIRHKAVFDPANTFCRQQKMSSKFSHEKSNRQSKVWREPTHASGGYGNDAFINRYRIDILGLHLRKSVIIHDGKVELLNDVHEFLRWLRFDLAGYSVSRIDTYPDFCKRNRLDTATSHRIFANLLIDLQNRIQMVTRRAARGIQCRQKNGADGKPEFCLTVDIPAVIEGLLTVKDSRVKRDD